MRKVLWIVAMWAWVVAQAAGADPMAKVSPSALLRADQFDKLEAYYDSYFKIYNPKIPNSYLPVQMALDRISYSSDLLPHLNKWVEAKPNSHYAHLIRGRFYVSHGWAARGRGYANTVSTEGWDTLKKMLTLADADLTKAEQLNPKSPFPYVEMMTIDRGLNRGLQATAANLVKARAIDPGYYPVFRQFMTSIQPRWGGSHETMREFAQNNADKLPGSNLPMLWIDYHWEMCSSDVGEGESWWKDPSHWAQLDAVFKKLIPIQPDPNELRTLYVRFAGWAGHPEVIREQLELCGADWREPSEHPVYFPIQRAWPGQDPNQWIIRKTTERLQKEPGAARALELRGQAYRDMNKYPEAIADLSRALELDPDLNFCWFELTYAHFYSKNYQKAIEAADHYMLREPANQHMMNLKGNSFRLMRRTDEAIAYMKDAIRKYPANPNGYYCLGLSLLDKKSYKEVIDTGEEGLKWAESDKDELAMKTLHWMIGTSYSNLNQTDFAFSSYIEALKLEHEDFMLNLMAGLYKKGGVWEGYKDRIVKAVEANYHGGGGDQRKHDQYLARFYEKIGSGSVQQKRAEAAAKANPKDADAQFALAKQHQRNGETEKGMQTIDAALKADPQNAGLRDKRGKYLQLLGRNDEALAIYRQLHSEQPNEPKYYDPLVRCLYANYKGFEAEALIDEFFSKYDETAPAEVRAAMLKYRATTYSGSPKDTAKLKLGIMDLEESARLNPNDPETFFRLTNLMMIQKDNKKALEYSRRSVELLNKNPGDLSAETRARFYVNYAMLLEGNGQPQQASEVFRQALAIDPNNKLAQGRVKRDQIKASTRYKIINGQKVIWLGK